MKKLYIIFLLAVILLTGCCKKVYFNPVMDLNKYEPVGIIRIDVNAEGNLDYMTTERFLEYMRRDQPGIQVLELGTRKEVLSKIGRPELDYEAIKLIGEKYKVKTVIAGNLTISDVKPKVDFSLSFPYVSARAEVDASLYAKMYETGMGSTVWSGSSRVKTEIGSVQIFKDHFRFNAEDPEQAYGRLVDDLVWYATHDFRGVWRCK